MDLKTYHLKAQTTAFYPNRGSNLVYAVLGLVEETSEVVEKIDRLDKQGLMKELGDQVWYISAICFEINEPLENLSHYIINLNLSKNQPCLQIMEEAIGKISAKTKKAIRDNNGILDAEKKVEIIENLGRIISAINTLSLNHGFDLSKVCEANIEKLLDRQNRGTLKGSGDNR